MKKLIIALLLTSSVQAQTPDTLTIQDMQYNLYRSHQEFKTGTVMTLLGALAVLASIQAKSSDMDIPELGYAGAVLITIGTVLHLDSHKFIGRSGRKSFGKRK